MEPPSSASAVTETVCILVAEGVLCNGSGEQMQPVQWPIAFIFVQGKVFAVVHSTCDVW